MIFHVSAFATLILLGVLILSFKLHAFGVLNTASWLTCYGIDLHLAFDSFAPELAERRLYIMACLRTWLEEKHISILLAEFFGFDRGDFPLLLQIYFIPYH